MHELPPGEASPYHWHAGEEEWLVVLRGAVTLRTPAGERPLGPWEVAAFVRGEAGAHQLRNDGDETARVVFFATRSDPDVRVYPDDGAMTVVAAGEVLQRR
ncbi:MAG TPA: cupin domain-containing protein [Gaiellaceae bacterium]|nr:cupin domain-containing protein [Gaiellaceae bacterium]